MEQNRLSFTACARAAVSKQLERDRPRMSVVPREHQMCRTCSFQLSEVHRDLVIDPHVVTLITPSCSNYDYIVSHDGLFRSVGVAER